MRSLVIVIAAVLAANFVFGGHARGGRVDPQAARAVSASQRDECRRYAAVFHAAKGRLLSGSIRTEVQYRAFLKSQCRPVKGLSLHDRAFLPVYRILQADGGKRWDIRRAAATAGRLERAFHAK